MISQSLDEALEEFKKEHLRCEECPPERNCCTAKGSYMIHFLGGQLEAILGAGGSGKSIEDLAAEGNASYDERSGYYALSDWRCPALTGRGLCGLQGEKERIGMEACLSFPMYVQRAYVRKRGEFRRMVQVLVDYRCHSIEQRWPELADELFVLQGHYRIPVMVKYAEDGHCWELPLYEFDRLCRGGGVPGQRLGQSWEGIRDDSPAEGKSGD